LRRAPPHPIDKLTVAGTPAAQVYDGRVTTDARAALIAEVSAAFADVRLGSGVGLFEAQGLDDYAADEERKALRERDEKEDWTLLRAVDLNRANSSFSFFDAAGMRFHLPAYLIADCAASTTSA
jgi:hypothetical protein